MATITPTNWPPASDAASVASDGLNDRLADAARYAVLCRIMPVLRHDVAGSMQPVRVLLMVLERRLQIADPDLEAIAKNVTSVSTLTKQATVDMMSALGWMASGEDVCVSLRSSVDEAGKLLELELSTNAIALVNGITDDSAVASQSFLRGVFIGALLAFCDQRVSGGTLQVTFDVATRDSQQPDQLQLRMLRDDSGKSPAPLEDGRKYRTIGWSDVQAMAQSCGVQMARGDDWLTLDLPQQSS